MGRERGGLPREGRRDHQEDEGKKLEGAPKGPTGGLRDIHAEGI